MKLFATTSILVVAALAALVPVAPAALPTNSQGLTPRERYELNQRYPQTHSLAPSPEALAARAPDLVERYVTWHPSGSSVATGRYVETRGLAPTPEALAARTSRLDQFTMARGLAPTPEALAAGTSSSDGFEWGGGLSMAVGILLAGLLLTAAAAVAARRTRERYASV